MTPRARLILTGALAYAALLAGIASDARAVPIYTPTAGTLQTVRTATCTSAVWLVGDPDSERSVRSCVRT